MRSFLGDVTVAGSNDFEDWKSRIVAGLRRQTEAAVAKWLQQCAFREDWKTPKKVLAAIEAAFGIDQRGPVVLGAWPTQDERFHADRSEIFGDRAVPLIGRNAQISALWDAWKVTKSGTPITVGILAEAGLGKTRLSEAFLQAVSSSARIIRASGYESSRKHGFGILRQAFANDEGREILPHLGEPWRGILAALLYGKAGANPTSNDKQEFIFEAVAQLLEYSSADTPVVLFIDDAQWADRATLDCLTYLELTRFGGHLILGQEGVHNGEPQLQWAEVSA